MLFFNKLLDAIALEKYSIWREFLIQGLEHEENEEAIKAIEMYNKAKNLIPSNSKSYIQLFNIYLNKI